MKQHTFRDNLPKSPNVGFTPRKIGLLSIPVVLSALMMYCGQQVNKIIEEKRNGIEETSPISQTEKTDIAESWREAGENQVLMIYRVKKGDTLSGIARKHGVTLESILSINKKIISPDAIRVGQAVIIPYDGEEETGEIIHPPMISSAAQTSAVFTKSSLISVMTNVLTRPDGALLGTIGNQPSDVSRLKTIAEKTGLGTQTKDVRYANLCAANMRAISASLGEHLKDRGMYIDLRWKNGKNGIGVGKYFSELKQGGRLPRGFEVIQTKSNPDIIKLKQLLLQKGKEYSIFVLSYSHDVDGHVNIAFRVGNEIIIFDPSWRGHSKGWPERFHEFEDYMRHFVNGKVTTGYTAARDRYDLYNITCVPTYKVDPIVHNHLPTKSAPSIPTSDTQAKDMRELTMIFEGFTPRMKIDTQDKEKNKITYAIGYGTNVGTLQAQYPFASYGKDVAEYLKKQGHSTDAIKEIMHCKRDISRSEARDLFELRYVPRYQKMRTLCGKNWSKYPPVIRNMLVDMSYNMGEYSIFPNGGNPGFPDAVAAMNRGDWVSFINEVVDSKYAGDVGARRLGKWIALVVRDVLNGKTAGLSQEARDMLSTYAVRHSRDINKEMAKRD